MKNEKVVANKKLSSLLLLTVASFVSRKVISIEIILLVFPDSSISSNSPRALAQIDLSKNPWARGYSGVAEHSVYIIVSFSVSPRSFPHISLSLSLFLSTQTHTASPATVGFLCPSPTTTVYFVLHLADPLSRLSPIILRLSPLPLLSRPSSPLLRLHSATSNPSSFLFLSFSFFCPPVSLLSKRRIPPLSLSRTPLTRCPHLASIRRAFVSFSFSYSLRRWSSFSTSYGRASRSYPRGFNPSSFALPLLVIRHLHPRTPMHLALAHVRASRCTCTVRVSAHAGLARYRVQHLYLTRWISDGFVSPDKHPARLCASSFLISSRLNLSADGGFDGALFYEGSMFFGN